MEWNNTWLQLIWLFVGGFVLDTYFPKTQERLGDKVVQRWDMLPAILMALPYLLWSGFRGNYADTAAYRNSFLSASSSLSAIGSVLSSGGKDLGFSVLIILIKQFIGNSDILFFLIIATVQMLCMVFVFRKYSADYWICIFLFIVSTDYMSWMHNGIRQFIAVTVIFAAFRWLVERRWGPLIALIVLISTIHGSALLMIPIIFVVQGQAWNRKTVAMLAATMVVIAFVDSFTPILSALLEDTQYSDMTSDEIWSGDNGTNMIRVAVYSVPAIMSLAGLRYVRAANDPVINICVNCSIVTMALYLVSAVTSGIYIGRLPIYTNLQAYMAVPWLIDHMFTKSSAKLVKLIMVVLYLGFFYYQMHFTWGLI